MCGIAAFLGEDARAGLAFGRRANALMAHRGPDDSGLYSGAGVTLAHRRLSILDLSARGHQPMTSPDGRFTLIYNGEIYNHQALRGGLERQWRFESSCDSETLLAALAIDGPAALERMVGMWALALWDARDERLFLSRDRYGQKPLYWRAAADGSLRFASEIAPLIEPDERPAAFLPALAEFLAVGSYDHIPQRTFFRDVRSFPAGSSAWIGRGERGFSPARYWRFPIKPQKALRPFDKAARDQVRRTFIEAVESQVLSDVPLAATLSGGVDSSSVVGAMASLSPGRTIKVFTAQAEGSAFDESRYVSAVKDLWGERLDIETIRSERMVLSALAEAVVRAQGEPFGDPSIIAHGLVVKAAAKAGVGVLIGGQGADEILLGYPYMSPSIVASQLRRGDRLWALRQTPKLGVGAGQYLRVLGSAIAPGLERELRRRSRQARYRWLSPALRAAGRAGMPPLSALSDLDAVWREGVETIALPHLLHYDDHNCMRHSIEGRMPFLDHRLAEVLSGVDTRAYFWEGRRKAPLREACADLLPRAVIERRDKIGFHTPLADLLRAEIDWVRAWVCGDAARAAGLYDLDGMAEGCDALAAGTADGYVTGVIWRALVVMIWIGAFDVAVGPGLGGGALAPRRRT
jgi:asparagine synthase (glutamine-hydrolysing)